MWFKNNKIMSVAEFKEKNLVEQLQVIEEYRRTSDKKMVPLLISLLADQNKEICLVSTEALAAIGDERSIKPLIDLVLTRPTLETHFLVGRALSKFKDDKVLDLFCAKLKNPRPSKKNKAVFGNIIIALGGLGDVRAVESLLQFLNTQDRLFLKEIITTLGWLKDQRSVESLMPYLYSDNNELREPAIWALANIGDKRVFEPILKFFYEDVEVIRYHAAIALGVLGNKEGFEPLMTASNSNNTKVAIGSIKGLGRLGDKRAVEPLLNMAMQNEQFDNRRKYVIDALGRLEDFRVINPLLNLLEKERNDIIVPISFILGRLYARFNEQAILYAMVNVITTKLNQIPLRTFETDWIIKTLAYLAGNIEPGINLRDKEAIEQFSVTIIPKVEIFWNTYPEDAKEFAKKWLIVI